MKRPIAAALNRGGRVLWTKRYARLDTALPRGIYYALMEGQPKDVLELYHAEFGFQIATVMLHVGGQITIQITENS